MVYIRKRIACMDQTVPGLIQKMCHHRTKKNMRESMSKWNYVIGVREQISGD